jgi:hypothetical protein
VCRVDRFNVVDASFETVLAFWEKKSVIDFIPFVAVCDSLFFGITVGSSGGS